MNAWTDDVVNAHDAVVICVREKELMDSQLKAQTMRMPPGGSEANLPWSLPLASCLAAGIVFETGGVGCGTLLRGTFSREETSVDRSIADCADGARLLPAQCSLDSRRDGALRLIKICPHPNVSRGNSP